MAQTLSGSVKIVWSHIYNNVLDLATVADTLVKTINTAYTNGTGAGKGQTVWTDQRVLTSGASETLDLRALAGSAFGTMTAAKIKELVIEVVTVTPGYSLTVGAAAANQFTAPFGASATGVVVVGPGSAMKLASAVDGFTVDSTHKDLKILNNAAGNLTYNIYILAEGTVA